MARAPRVDVGDQIYHVINRAVGRLTIFKKPKDYAQFIMLMIEAKEMTGMRILSFVIMPNHWHLQLYPHRDKDLSIFMHWLTNAHTRRVHTLTKTIGTGPLYQGRYKSFLTEDDTHLLGVLKYIERNPVRAKLAKKVEDWQWGSAWIRQQGTSMQKTLLCELPIPLPRNYRTWINTPDREDDLLTVRNCVNKGKPFGNDMWVEQMVDRHKLEGTQRPPGRPLQNIKTH